MTRNRNDVVDITGGGRVFVGKDLAARGIRRHSGGRLERIGGEYEPASDAGVCSTGDPLGHLLPSS